MAAKVDPWCLPGAEALGHLERYWQRKIRIEAAELREKLNAQWTEGISVEREHSSNRVQNVTLTMRLVGTQTRHLQMSGHQFRKLVGLQKLRSTRWSPDSPVAPYVGESGVWIITSFGYGHGVGLSQVSAYAMANAGHNAYSILQFFYDHAVIQRLW